MQNFKFRQVGGDKVGYVEGSINKSFSNEGFSQFPYIVGKVRVVDI